MQFILIGSAVLIAVVFVSVYFYRRGKKSRTGKKVLSEMLADTDDVADLMKDLRAKWLRNEETVKRLISVEKEIRPDANETEWIRAAIVRWERDNR